jgi:hypothetical protein
MRRRLDVASLDYRKEPANSLKQLSVDQLPQPGLSQMLAQPHVTRDQGCAQGQLGYGDREMRNVCIPIVRSEKNEESDRCNGDHHRCNT